MSFTYDPDLLSSSLLFQVRLRTGQTNPYSLLTISDEEILYFLNEADNDVRQASLEVLNSLIARSHVLIDKTTGQVSESQSQVMQNIIRLRDDLIGSLSRSTPDFAQITGVYVEDMEQVQDDPEIFHDGVERLNQGPTGGF